MSYESLRHAVAFELIRSIPIGSAKKSLFSKFARLSANALLANS